MPRKQIFCCATFKWLSGRHIDHKRCRKDKNGGEVGGRKLNVLLGQDPDDTNFMDPEFQYFVCYAIKHKADQIKGGDSRLKKAKPAGNEGGSRRSRRIEILNPARKKLDEDSVKKIKKVVIFDGLRYHFEDDVEDEEQAEA